MTTPPEPAPTNPPPAPNPTPDPPPRPPVVVNHDNGLGTVLNDLAQAVRAMPETLIHSLQESNHVPPQQATTTENPSPTGNQPQVTPENPAQDPNAKRGFADWWFKAGRKS